MKSRCFSLRSSPFVRNLLVTVCVGLVAGFSLQAQSKRFGDTTSVTVVEVPVQVLRDGDPVRGLTAEDFEVLDGGKKQEIVAFEAIDLSMSAPADEAASAATVAPAARRHFLLLFDLSFSNPESVVKAREAARQLVLAGLHPADLVAVATYNRSQGARLALGFTSDRRQVEVALDTLGLPQLLKPSPDPLGVLIVDIERPELERPANPGRFGVDSQAEMLEILRRSERGSQRDLGRSEILALTASLGELAKMMRGVSGRKQVVYLSEGFDSSILLGLAGDSDLDRQRIQQLNEAAMSGEYWEVESDERFGSTTTQNQLDSMLQEFIRADCAIQAVDIGGLRAGVDVQARGSGQDGMFTMAKSTGGEFYSNYNNLADAMGEMLERTSVSYLLAIQPKNLKPDGSYHRLKVRLKSGARGAAVVHRPGYFAPKPFGDQDPEERRLAAAGMIMGGGEGGSVDTSILAPPFMMSEVRAYVPVLIEIDGSSLLGGARSGVLPTEIYAYAIGRDGAIADYFTQALGLDLGKVAPALEQSGFKFWGHFELAPGDYSVRVLVRNGLTGASGLRDLDVTVPALAESQAALLPPLFPEPQGKWLLGREPQEDQPQVDYPFMIGGQAFIPAARPVLRPGQAQQIALAGYNLGSGSLGFEGRLVSADGRSVACDLQLQDRPATGFPGFDRMMTSLVAGSAPAGLYRLEVTVTDTATGKALTSSLPVRVEG